MSNPEKEGLKLQREEIIEKFKPWLRQVKATTFEEHFHPQINPNDIVFKVTRKLEPSIQLKSQTQTQEGQLSLSYFIILPSDIDLVKISIYYHFKESDNVGFKLLLPDDKFRFVNNLRIPLLLMNLNYTWIPDLMNFESLEMHKQIFYEGFNKHTFFDTIFAIIHAYEILMVHFEQFLNSVKKQRKG
jgi:hypothetical protein